MGFKTKNSPHYAMEGNAGINGPERNCSKLEPEIFQEQRICSTKNTIKELEDFGIEGEIGFFSQK